MSKKNEPDLSPFAYRLLGLMESKGCPTAVKLAEKLIEENLVKVDTREKDSKRTPKERAIESVRKKIAAHLNADDASCLQGEFALAYSKFFGCSLEYLFMESDVFCPVLEIGEICQWTGLQEDAVINLHNAHIMEGNSGKSFMGASQVWSRMMSSSLFNSVVDRYKKAVDVKIQEIKDNLIFEKALKEHSLSKTDEEKQETLRYIDQCQRQVELDESAARGIMFDVSSIIKDYLEDDIAEFQEKIFQLFTYTYLGSEANAEDSDN